MSNQPTLLEQSVESTRKLAWFDDTIRHYAMLQYAAAHIAENMKQQVRMDEKAFGILTSAYNLATAKLDKLNEARQTHYERHERIMGDILDGRD